MEKVHYNEDHIQESGFLLGEDAKQNDDPSLVEMLDGIIESCEKTLGYFANLKASVILANLSPELEKILKNNFRGTYHASKNVQY